MTRIVVFCDGTWNSPTIEEPTSVYKLYKAVESDFSKGQLAAYFKGIGTDDRFDGKVRKVLNRYGGGAFGWGLDAKVKQAYQFIAQAYRKDDEIYLFGFSRGAYTARSVAGMIRKCGIVADTSTEGINAAFDLYRKRGQKNLPDSDHIWGERLRISPKFGTSDKDITRRDNGSSLVKIAYLGVFDTVGARGIPPSLFGPVASMWNRQYRFHDMQLSSLVQSARHALALDERRVFYKPAKWDNLDALNDGDNGVFRPYQQIWFVGNHSMVGGSNEDAQPIAVIPLDWIMQGAGRMSMKTGIQPSNAVANVLIDSSDLNSKWALLKKWRKGPDDADDTHPSVVERVRGREDYRPKSLKKIFDRWSAQLSVGE